MKRFIKKCLLSGLLLFAVLAVAACSANWDPPYEALNKSGYTVSIKFDANGGVFAGTNDVYIIDVFNLEDAQKGVYLLEPEDPLRAEGAFDISKNGYFLAGWYSERNLRVDENGQALDEYGVPVSQSGREQGYTYSGKWDFDTDKFTVSDDTEYSSETPAVTLYAAWIPYFSYEFYAENETGEFSYLDSYSAIDLEIPEWNENTGKLDAKNFPSRDGYTVDAVYLDADKHENLTEKISGAERFVDYETGTTSVESIKIYTTWLEGNWFKIYNAKQFYNNSRLDGNYILCADIDFSDDIWSPTLTKGKFTGKIIGNGYTISNINVVQADNSQLFGGLFGTVEDSAVFENVRFENITYEINAGSRMQGATFGLFAGTVSADAEFKDFEISGSLIISNNCYPQNGYVIGLFCGAGGYGDIDISGISCAANDDADKITVETDENGSVTLIFN